MEAEKPRPRKDELLIRIHATTVTIGDVIIRRLPFPIRIGLGLVLGKGRVLGHELAGEVEAVGADVTRFRKGDQVFASTGYAGGANAEYICLAETGTVSLKPASLSFEEAAAVPVGALTALDLLRRANIQPGQSALVYGASGSVGSCAVQLARHFGAEVTAVTSTANLEWVKALGADRVIDYTQGDLSKTGDTYDVVFDAVGKMATPDGKRCLKPDGTYLSVRSPTKESAEALVFIKEIIEAGGLKPVIDRTYPLERVAEAHAYVAEGHKRGNVVLVVSD
jgi:NADPH:quinone reductase-like Zn-dependent oxidoreductase